MFDLDEIEKYWQEHSFRLTEDEVIKIYESEGATKPQYEEKWDEWRAKYKEYDFELTAEEELLMDIFGDDYIKDTESYKERVKRKEEFFKKYQEPEKKYLSKNSQKIVVEGLMHLVFEHTRYWYKLLKEQVPEETIYYICLETLMHCVKAVIHCGKPVFGLYVNKAIMINMTRYIAKHEHLSYQQCHKILRVYELEMNEDINFESIKYHKDDCEGGFKRLSYDYQKKDELLKPETIHYILKNEPVKEDVIDGTLEEEFNKTYQQILNEFSEEERMVMQFSYDKDGYPGLTYKEISDYLGLDEKDIKNAKRRALRKLRKDERLKSFLK